MIPDLQCSVVCDDVRQERNGKFILIGLFDMIGLPQFPGLFPRMCIVNRWCCGEGSFHEKTRIVAPDNGPVIAEGRGIPVGLPNSEASVTNVEFFLNLRFDVPGVYWIEIMLDGDMTLRYPLRVNKVNPPRASPEGGTPA